MYSLVTLPSEYRLYTMSDQSSGLIVRFQIRAFIAPKYCGLAVATGRKGGEETHAHARPHTHTGAAAGSG